MVGGPTQQCSAARCSFGISGVFGRSVFSGLTFSPLLAPLFHPGTAMSSASQGGGKRIRGSPAAEHEAEDDVDDDREEYDEDEEEVDDRDGDEEDEERGLFLSHMLPALMPIVRCVLFWPSVNCELARHSRWRVCQGQAWKKQVCRQQARCVDRLRRDGEAGGC